MQPQGPHNEISRERRIELGLMFSHTCNITCRHCGIFSSPQNKNKMRMEDARRWIMDAGRIPMVKHINFTGGEPFLFQDEHAELFALCRSLGFGTRVVTNGFWAKTVDAGLEVLSRMKEAGLTELNFSADVFHLEFLAPETLRNALECARQLGYFRVVNFVMNSKRDPLEEFSTLYGVPRADLTMLIPSKIGPLLLNPATQGALKDTILVYAGGLIGLGRAANYPADLQWFDVDQLPGGPCLEVVNKPVIYPDGVLQACCCAGGKLSPFTVGNLHQESLEAILEKMIRRSQFQFINTNGPKALFQLVAEVRPELPRRDNYTSICEMCVRATDGLSATELDEIANYGLLKNMFELVGGDFLEASPAEGPASERSLTSTTSSS